MKKEHRYPILYRGIAWFLLASTLIGMFYGTALILKRRQELAQKLVIVVATFEGPENVYGLRNEILENLNADFNESKEVEIIPISDVITPADGQKIAQERGKDYQADVVVWGWYRSTENPNITFHVENLSPKQFVPIKKSETLRPVGTLAELESFELQQQLGQETSALISFLVGYIKYQSGNYAESIRYYDRALDSTPEQPRLSGNRAKIYFARGNANSYAENYEDAVTDYGQALQLDPKRAVFYYRNRGLAYFSLGQYELALSDYNQAIELDSQDANTYVNRGAAYYGLGQYERAMTDYSQAISLDPRDALAYYDRASSYYALGQYSKAIADYDKYLQLEPEDAIAHYNRGLNYYYLDQYEKAIADYDQAILLNPLYGNAYTNRGVAYSKLEQYDRSILDLNKAIQIDSSDAFAYLNRGISYALIGEYELSMADLSQAIQLDPQMAVAYYVRGSVYEQLGKTAEAEVDFKKYEELTGEKP